MSNHRTYQRFTLQAEERLKLRNDIETLFRQGEAFSVFQLRAIFLLSPNNAAGISPVRVGFSIPKKRIRLANGRNRVRRLLKEAWRLQKHIIYSQIPVQFQLHCFLVYTGTPIAKEFTITMANAAMAKLLDKLAAKVLATQ